MIGTLTVYRPNGDVVFRAEVQSWHEHAISHREVVNVLALLQERILGHFILEFRPERHPSHLEAMWEALRKGAAFASFVKECCNCGQGLRESFEEALRHVPPPCKFDGEEDDA